MAQKKQTHFAGANDAHQAAIQKGLKEGEFEITSGPKGYSFRKRKKYTPVPNAKMHVGKDPEKTVEDVLNEEVPGYDHIFIDKSLNRYRWADETWGLSQESYETIEQAKAALDTYVANILGPPPNPEKEIESVPIEVIGKTEDEVMVQKEEIHPPTAEKRECPDCNKSVDTFVSGEDLRYVEHPGKDFGICNMSEEIVRNPPVGGIPISEFKPSEVAKIQATSAPAPIPVGMSGGIPILNRSTIPDPTKTVWDIADKMKAENPDIRRKDIIAACVDRGIAFYTARTQVQAWRTAHKADPPPEPEDAA